MEKSTEYPIWPVIVHQSMKSTDISAVLNQRNLKLRYSDTIVPNSVIFPLSGVAFLVVRLNKCMTTCQNLDGTERLEPDIDTQNRIEKFLQVHRLCYLLCQAPLFGSVEHDAFCELQQRYLHTKLNLLPIHNAAECVQAMVTIAKALCKPESEILNARLNDIISEQTSNAVLPAFLCHIGLDMHQIQVIEDGLGSLSRLAQATKEELLDCSLDVETVHTILAVFREKPEMRNRNQLKIN